jgi:hypothetical protein
MSDSSNEELGQYISEQQHKDNLTSQLETSPELVEQFRGFGITEDRTCRLEYFFYTNSQEKAASLSIELCEMGYASKVQESGPGKKIRVVAGATVPVQMATEKVLEWTELMCTVGFKHDCEFDGWGLNPEQ